MGNTTSIESPTLLDRFPTEIILEIFVYLSNNDIIYTFFFFNQRFHNLLFQNPRYLISLELPTTNLNTWKTILPMIGSQIEYLNLNTIYLSFPLTYFPNLKSLNLSSRHGLADEELKSIIESKQFETIESFKLKENHRSSTTYYDDYDGYLNSHSEILKKLFHNKSLLKIFQYSLVLPSFELIHIDNIETNYKLHSLTIVLTDYQDIFSLLEYTPNLKYLNVQSKPPYTPPVPINNINLKLERLYLKLGTNEPGETLWSHGGSMGFDLLINNTNQFSSSLTCLSLNLVCWAPFNSIKLQQWLESMRELKEFYFYAKLIGCLNPDHLISSEFQNQFWFDHHWSFGMHGDYLYTLPFHFDYLYEFPTSFQTVKSNNPEILINNPRIWYKVKSLELLITDQYNTNFVRELKMKMPNLSFIKFIDPPFVPIHKTLSSNDEPYEIDVILNKLTTIHFTGSVERENKWLINSLPNLRHLIFSSTELSSIEFSSEYSQSARRSNQTTQSMDKDVYFTLKQLTEINENYFSNVQQIIICLNDSWALPTLYADSLIQILRKYQNLKTFLIYISQDLRHDTHHFVEERLCEFIYRLRMDRFIKNYEIKSFRRYCLISKCGFNDGELQEGISFASRKSSHFFNIIRHFSRKKES